MDAVILIFMRHTTYFSLNSVIFHNFQYLAGYFEEISINNGI